MAALNNGSSRVLGLAETRGAVELLAVDFLVVVVVIVVVLEDSFDPSSVSLESLTELVSELSFFAASSLRATRLPAGAADGVADGRAASATVLA
jgi:hypothetical protein